MAENRILIPYEQSQPTADQIFSIELNNPITPIPPSIHHRRMSGVLALKHIKSWLTSSLLIASVMQRRSTETFLRFPDWQGMNQIILRIGELLKGRLGITRQSRPFGATSSCTAQSVFEAFRQPHIASLLHRGTRLLRTDMH